VARILIVGGGCRGRRFSAEMIEHGHVVRATTRTEAARAAIESTGAECWIGTPDRLATLRGALDSVTIACWLLGTASGPSVQLDALHGSRLEFFLTQAIDTTVRGVIYEASGTAVTPQTLAAGEAIVRSLTERNEIPVAILRADPGALEAWLAEACEAVDALLTAS
jgi:uncharacterized protein YbjT (DUF2867 family)